MDCMDVGDKIFGDILKIILSHSKGCHQNLSIWNRQQNNFKMSRKNYSSKIGDKSESFINIGFLSFTPICSYKISRSTQDRLLWKDLPLRTWLVNKIPEPQFINKICHQFVASKCHQKWKRVFLDHIYIFVFFQFRKDFFVAQQIVRKEKETFLK